MIYSFYYKCKSWKLQSLLGNLTDHEKGTQLWKMLRDFKLDKEEDWSDLNLDKMTL